MQTTQIHKAGVLALFLGYAVSLSGTEQKPEVQLEQTVRSVIEVLYQPDSIEVKRERVLEVLGKTFSFDLIIRRTLGRNWDALTPDQQMTITRLATDLLIRSYTQEFKTGERPKVVFKAPVELSANKLEIASTLSLSTADVNLSYRMARLENGWQVYDLLVEGVSLVSNYRKQFDAHFQKESGDALIDKLEKKLEAL